MTRFWKWLDGADRYYAPEDGGGGGDVDDGGDDGGGGGGDGEHPDFEIPGGVGADDDGEHGEGNPPLNTGVPRPPAAGVPGGGRGPGGQPVDTVPKHRLDEVIRARDDYQRQHTAAQQEAEKLRAFIATTLGIQDPTKPPGPKELSPREQAIQQRIFELVPWLKDLQGLAGQAQSLAGLAQQMPAFERQANQYWSRVATTMFEEMENGLAGLFLGNGKTAKDLEPAMKARYRQDFFRWVEGDPKRVARYEAIDRTLVDDYRTEVETTVVAPLRRQFGVQALSRSRAIGKLPVSGTGAAPVAAGGKPRVPQTDDEAAEAAWANLQERVSQG